MVVYSSLIGKSGGYRVGDFPCFTAFLFFGPYSNLKFTYTCIITGDEDYVTGPYNVTVFAGITRRMFNISLVNNNILELTETFRLTIDSSLLPSKVLFSNQDSATVSIIENDSMFLCYMIR